MIPREQLLLGQAAVQKGLLSSAQLDECIAISESSLPRKPLSQVLVEKGFLTPQQVEGILADAQPTQQSPSPDQAHTVKELPGPPGTGADLKTQAGEPELPSPAQKTQAGKPALPSPAPKPLLHCPRCRVNFAVTNYQPGSKVLCPKCSSGLVVPRHEMTLDARVSTRRAVVHRPADVAAGRAAGEPFGPEVAAPDGEHAPRYRLLELLGAGGMGKVYKAWDRQLNRLVALKQLLHEDPAAGDQIERFERESRAAAKLDHPNIVPVYDVGEHAGRHYFTMRFVEGIPLNKFTGAETAVGTAAAKGPSPRAAAQSKNMPPVRRLIEITRDVARALHYAHQQGVIHRDVKPHNILLDSRGTPHVTDFGLAKDVSSAAKSGLSATGQWLGTPSYMSPEHTMGNPKLIGPAADQFSLGVVLYELLTGQLPFGVEDFYQLLQAIRENDPPKPTEIRRNIPRDVETICLKALEKEPARRYSSLEEMADDIERFLSDEPIAARPISCAQRLWRRVKHNRAALALGATAVVLALAFALWFAIARFKHGSDVAKTREAMHQACAENRWQDANAAATALLSLEPADVEALAAKDDSRRRMEEEAKRLEDGKLAAESDRRKSDVALQAERIADKVKGLSPYLYGTSLPIEEYWKAIDECFAEFQALATEHPDVPTVWYLRGRIRLMLGDFESAESDLTKALELDPKLYVACLWRARLYCEWRLSLIYGYAGQSSGERSRLHTEKLLRAAADLKSLDSIASAARLGADENRTRVLVDALAKMAERDLDAMAILETANAESPNEEYLNLMGLVAVSNRDFARGEELQTKALALRPRYWKACGDRAITREKAGDHAGAVADYDAAIAMNPRFSLAYNNRGRIGHGQGDHDGALADFNKAIEINPLLWIAYLNRSNTRDAKGDDAGALADCNKAIEIDPSMAAAYSNRALLLRDKGDLDGALADCGKAIELDPEYAVAYSNRSIFRRLKGDLNGALADSDKAIALDPGFAHAYIGRANVRKRLGDLDGALEDYTAAIENYPRKADVYFERGKVFDKKGDNDAALADFDEAIRLDPSFVAAYRARARAFEAKGNVDAAIADYSKAIELDPRCAEAYHNRARARAAKGDMEGARADRKRVLEADPSSADGHTARALARIEVGNWNGAIEDADAAIKADPDLAEAYFARAVARAEKGDVAGAISDYDSAIARKPRFSEAYGNRGVLRMQTGDLKGAMADYDMTIEINPRDAKAYCNRGNLRGRMKDLDGAIADQTKAIELDSRFIEPIVNRGALREAKGDIAGAIADYTKALELAPANWPHRKAVQQALDELKKK